MIDYHGLSAAVGVTISALHAAQEDPTLAPTAEEIAAAVDEEPEIARLGAMIAPLLALAGPAEAELDLVRRASGLWRRGLVAAEALRTARIEFELALTRDDVPDAVGVLQMGLDRLAGLHGIVRSLKSDAEALQAEVGTLAYLSRHPRQADAPAASWDWPDAFAGRRGLAFVEAMVAGAGSARGLAFAGGALAGYAGHVAGSAWLGTVVGGPRRLHRFRDRLARNTLGLALRRIVGGPDLGDLAARLRFDRRDELALAEDLSAQLAAALTSAYPARAAPDLALGYRRMIEHLELLSVFQLPPPPEPPPILALASGQAEPIETQTFGAPEGDADFTITMGPDTDHESPGVSSQKKAQGDVCLYILLLIATLGIAYLLWCIGRLTVDKKCGIEDFVGASSPEEPDPTAPQASQQMLVTLREAEKTNHILDDIYQLQLKVWQAFAAARSFLVVCGLIYPQEGDLSLPLFRKLLEIPPPNPWPRREVPGAEENYATYPTTPAEDPAQPPPFPDRGPEWLLHVNPVDNASTISEVVFETLRAMQGRVEDKINFDLDADRGRLHPAWAVAPGTSIRDQPLSVEILGFETD